METRNSETATSPSPSSRAGATAAAPLCLCPRLIGTTMDSVNDAHASSPAEFFHARDEVTIRLNIIAFSLHHHHEIALPLYIEENASFTSSFTAQRVQRVHGGIRCRLQ